MDVHQTYCSNHFMLSHYAVNLHSAVCHLYLNNTRRKKEIQCNRIFTDHLVIMCFHAFLVCPE